MTRGWVYTGEWSRTVAKYEISWGRKLCVFGVGFDGEDGHITLTWAVPGLFTHFGVAWPRRWTPKSEHYGDIELFRISIHEWAIWWAFGRDNSCWNSGIPKWRDGNFSVINFVLGRTNYTTEVIEEAAIKIAMPEAEYQGTAKLMRAQWKRPRWPWPHVVMRAEIEIPNGVPFPGKGENSWDCGEDATYSMTAPANSIAEGVQKFTESVMRDRHRHGGPGWEPEVAA